MLQSLLDEILEGRRSQPDQLIEVLQDVQAKNGFISEEAMTAVSKGLGVSLMEVYRVASFYKAFSLQPRGKNLIKVCTGTACHVRGSKMLINQATTQIGVDIGQMSGDGLFTVEHVNCLGACALGPIVTVNEDYHHHMSPGRIRKLIKSRQNGGKEKSAHEKN